MQDLSFLHQETNLHTFAYFAKKIPVIYATSKVYCSKYSIARAVEDSLKIWSLKNCCPKWKPLLDLLLISTQQRSPLYPLHRQETFNFLILLVMKMHFQSTPFKSTLSKHDLSAFSRPQELETCIFWKFPICVMNTRVTACYAGIKMVEEDFWYGGGAGFNVCDIQNQATLRKIVHTAVSPPQIRDIM